MPRPALTVRLSLRAAGLALLLALWPMAAWLTHAARGQDQPSPLLFAVGCLCFMSASAGAALLIAGWRLIAPVTVSRRWS